jgi:hypothetical protein
LALTISTPTSVLLLCNSAKRVFVVTLELRH